MPGAQHIFISHATADDDFVKELRIKLQLHGLDVWVDSRNLRGGDKLQPEIEKAIAEARHVLAVLSPKTINSIWVRDEIRLAEQQAKEREDYQVIPLLLPDVEPAALKLWFEEEPVGVKIELAPGQLQERLPEILAALGERLPDDPQPPETQPLKPLAELLLELDPSPTHPAGGRFIPGQLRGRAGIHNRRSQATCGQEQTLPLHLASWPDRDGPPALVPGILSPLAHRPVPQARRGDRGPTSRMGKGTP